jgi:hypothetical protein
MLDEERAHARLEERQVRPEGAAVALGGVLFPRTGAVAAASSGAATIK